MRRTDHLACVASVSTRVRRERWDESKKKGMTGEGRGDMETLARKSHDLEKLRSPTNAASDWCGAGSVDYLNSNQCINQTRHVLFTCVADLV